LLIEFKNNGDFVVSGPNPGLANSPLWEFNKYEFQADNSIRFFNSNTSADLMATYTLHKTLELDYMQRCGFDIEKFIPH